MLTIDDEKDRIAQRIGNLSPVQRQFLAGKLALHNGDEGQAVQAQQAGRLTACIKPRAGADTSIDELRRFARERLPEYMTPQLYRFVEGFPQTGNGKIDREALPSYQWAYLAEPDAEWAGDDVVAPGSENEQVLADIWVDVLGVGEISIHDNFFEVGGDSLLSIRILARANKAGLNIAPEDFFSYPTIAEQAALVQQTSTPLVKEGPVQGVFAMTPIQHWFFDRITSDPQHWNQSVLLRVAEHLDYLSLERALQQLLLQHDVLRSNFIADGGHRQQVIHAFTPELPLKFIDLSSLSTPELLDALEGEARILNSSLQLAQGSLIRLVYAKTPDGEPNRLLVIMHHLIVDAESWRIFLQDLEQVWSSLAQGKVTDLPVKTTSFLYWAERLREYANSERLLTELAYWQRPLSAGVSSIPLDYEPELKSNTNASADMVSVSLSEGETTALLRSVPQIFRTEINDALLTALLLCISEWSNSATMLVDIEGHGRETLFEDVDISRTMGWFTTVYPVLLETGDSKDLGDTLVHIKEQLRQLPQRGIGYGLLRELKEGAQETSPLRAAPQAQVCFNYLGQVDKLFSTSRSLTRESDDFGQSRSPDGPRGYILEVNAKIEDHSLRIDWTYSRHFHDLATINGLAQRYVDILRELVNQSQSADSVVHSPSDFPLADLGQDELDAISNILSDADAESP